VAQAVNLDGFDTRHLGAAVDAIAPDGCEVRVLCATARGSMAQFALAPGAVSRAVAHRTIEEIWFFMGGRGRMWRCRDERAEILDVQAGVSISILPQTRFQFRCDGAEPLVAIGVAMPPWPGADEAVAVEGIWQPTA
jgi:mannose-6-phosphate isomerase-like protein (cupin superfamily)